MPADTRHASRRRVIIAALATVVLLLGAPAPSAAAGDGFRETLLRLINDSREDQGMRTLRLNVSLSADAMRHTRRMLREDRVFDPPNLEEILSRYRYEHLGAAAVGCDATLRQLHRSLMSSDMHRSILLHPQLRRVGIGVLRAQGDNRCGSGSFWATGIFYG
jgi:uncharacterized protein YkwD